MSIKDKLQIILITYNRFQHVKKTFEQFILADASPVKNFDILVLDNNSTDNTKNYIDQLISSHSNIKYSKNKYNLGISGNIAKAMEIADKEYLWIICDDDIYDWSNWNEIETAIENNEEVICAARYAVPTSKKNQTEYQLLQLTFVPAIIIKTSVYNDTNIRNSFDNIFTLFPHLFPIIPFINKNKEIYVVNKAVVNNGMNLKNTDCSYIRGVQSDELCQRTRTMTWITGYANVCSMIQNKKIKHKTMLCAINFIHGNFSKFCKNMHALYFEKKNWFQIIDVISPLDTASKLKLFFSLLRRHFIGACTENDYFVIRMLLFKIKFKIKKYIENDYIVIDFNFMKAKKHIGNQNILLNIFHREFKIK
ncbi:MAG: glycosyltransferase family 2 protein [Endomicrobiaceae bacterium]|nr:glycosyltransferase family 2 protein [Endomicrobiaceae bacterium]